MSKEKKVEINAACRTSHYKEEFTAQLEDMGITSVPELRRPLRHSGKSKKIMDDL